MGESIQVQPHEFQAKWYLNGFPKSGLHWLALILRPVAAPQIEEDIWVKPWAGMFMDNSWSERKVELEKFLYKVGRLQDGHYLKGHTGFDPEVERFLWYLGAAHVFIYRDLRDVAVSQAYHVTSTDDEHKAHPEKELYQGMDSFDDVLAAVITGVQSKARPRIWYSGVIDRWRHYAGWLDVPWTFKVRFEELKDQPTETVTNLLKYGLSRVAPIYGCRLNVDSAAFPIVVDAMVNHGNKTELSGTFRKGAKGDWREHFTERHKALFKKADADGWLVRLGYESNDRW